MFKPAASVLLPEARMELKRVLHSRTFRRARLRRDLLSFLFEESSQGHTPDEKQVAKVVLKRENFNPRRAPNVRVHLLALRRTLQRYYQGEGRGASAELRVPYSAMRVELQHRPALKISFKRFGRFLKGMSREIGLTNNQCASIIRSWLEQPEAAAVVELLHARGLNGWDNLTFDSFVGELRDFDIDYSVLASIVKSFGIHQILLDVLRSQETVPGVDSIRLHLEDDFFRVGEDGSKSYGRKVAYSIPIQRLSGTDAAFVVLQLEKGGRSDTHSHMGDEFCLVLEGSVEYRLENSGLRTLLQEGDFIPFYAEQPHSAASYSGRARLLIVRSYQLDDDFMRQKMRTEVEQQKSARYLQLTSLTLGWMRQAIESRSVDNPDRVYDNVGLARLVKSLRVPPILLFRTTFSGFCRRAVSSHGI